MDDNYALDLVGTFWLSLAKADAISSLINTKGMRPVTQQLVTVVTGLLRPLGWMGVADRWGFNLI